MSEKAYKNSASNNGRCYHLITNLLYMLSVYSAILIILEPAELLNKELHPLYFLCTSGAHKMTMCYNLSINLLS